LWDVYLPLKPQVHRMQIVLAFVCVLCAIAPTQASRIESLPEPYGHTANVSPHLPNQDREWYTEYRFKGNQKYKPQDGVITTQPMHAPIPKKEVVAKKSDSESERKVKVLNSKPKHAKEGAKKTVASNKTAADGTKDQSKKIPGPVPTKISAGSGKAKDEGGKKKADKEVAAANEEKAKQVTAPKPAKKKTNPKKVWKDERYAVPEPCGHTANVHPTNSNRDREWYTEYRWQAGTEYKPQDGAITEVPKPALRGISTSPITGDPCVQVH